MEKKILSKFLKQIFETNTEFAEWFGYYNYDTLNSDQNKMLCGRSIYDGCAIKHGMTIELGYYDIPSGDWHPIGVSDSFSWPQGSMLQWLPGVGNENKVIYNCSEDNHIVSKIKDIETGEQKTLDWPIYGITPDGKKSIALNMERSYWCRAYHYQSVANDDCNVPILSSDGIFEVDLENNTKKRIVDINDVISIDADANFGELKHWLEHIMINKDGSKFVFLHRFSPVDKPMLYETRMVIANIDGSDLQIIPGWRDYSWSHFGWRGSNAFSIYTVKIPSMQKQLTGALKNSSNNTFGLSFSSIKKGMLSFIKKLLPHRVKKMLKSHSEYYQYYELNANGKFILKDVLNQKFFNIDGHPSFTEDGKYMITDSYPDKDKFQRLIVFNMENKKGIIIGRFYAPLKGNPASCDLHPKLCRDNKYLVVDSAYTGRHRMIMFELNWNEIKNQIG